MSSNKTLCTYRITEDGVHEFVLLEPSRAGVDEFVKRLLEMYDVVPPGTARPVLFESTRGVPPLNYLFMRLRTTVRLRNGEHASPVAVILPSSRMSSIISEMLRLFSGLKCRIFTLHQNKAALEWLETHKEPIEIM